MVQTEKRLASSENLERIQELKARRDRIQERLIEAGAILFKAKEERDDLLLALYGVDHQIELLEEGQMPFEWEEE